MEERRIALWRLAKLAEQELNRVDRPHRVQDAAQYVHFLEYVRRNQKLFLTSPRPSDVDRRERPFISHLAIQDNFGIAGSLELLEDHFVHSRPSVDQGRGNDRERTTFLDIPRRTEEPLGSLKRVGVDATGQDLA